MDGLWISYISKDIHAAIIPWSKYHLIKNHIVTNETKKGLTMEMPLNIRICRTAIL